MKRTMRVILSIAIMVAFIATSVGFITIPVKSIKLNTSSVKISVGKTYTLKVSITPTNATNKKLTFSSENKSIATVDSKGKITGIKPGKTVIAVSSLSNKKAVAKCNVTIIPVAPARISWYFVGSFPQPGEKEVWEKANEITKREINAEVKFYGMGWGDYESKMKVMIATGEPYDLAFTCGWLNNYVVNSLKGAFLPLDDYLAKSPYFDMVGKKFWDGARVNGKVYAVIRNQMMASMGGSFTANAEMFDAVGVKPDSIKSLEDIEAAAIKIKAKFPGLTSYVLPNWTGVPRGREFLLDPAQPPALLLSKSGSTVVENQFKSDLFKKYIKMMKRWNDIGILNGSELLTINDRQPLRLNKKLAIWFNDNFFPSSEEGLSANYGYKLYQRSFPNINDGTYEWTTSTGWAMNAMNGVSVNSKNPKAAFDLAVLVNTNAELYNLLVYGIEGRDYKVISQGPKRIEKAQAGNLYKGAFSSAMGSAFLGYLFKDTPADFIEQCIDINKQAKAGIAFGFTYNPSAVTAEVAKCASVYKEYAAQFDNGLSADIDKEYAAFIEKMDKAGAEAIVADAQKQLDLWLKTKK